MTSPSTIQPKSPSNRGKSTTAYLTGNLPPYILFLGSNQTKKLK